MKISVLLAAFNEEPYLLEAIESVKRQDHQDWELVLVDDGSTDGTSQIMRGATEGDARIKVASMGVKLGKVGAFNAAYNASNGDFIVMLGGDDVMTSVGLSARVCAYKSCPDSRVATFHKIRTMSESAKFDGQIIPRGKSGNTSGPGMGFSREVADLIFPIPDHLVSEDIWLSEAAEAVSTKVVHGCEVVTNYRIHAHNSNPRHKSFSEMSESIHLRMEARKYLLNSGRLPLPADQRTRLTAAMRAEDARYHGQLLAIARMHDMRLVDRLANLSMTHPLLWSVRSRLFKTFSGWRGR